MISPSNWTNGAEMAPYDQRRYPGSGYRPAAIARFPSGAFYRMPAALDLEVNTVKNSNSFIGRHRQLLFVCVFVSVWVVVQLCLLAGSPLTGTVIAPDPGGSPPTPWWP